MSLSRNLDPWFFFIYSLYGKVIRIGMFTLTFWLPITRRNIQCDYKFARHVNCSLYDQKFSAIQASSLCFFFTISLASVIVVACNVPEMWNLSTILVLLILHRWPGHLVSISYLCILSLFFLSWGSNIHFTMTWRIRASLCLALNGIKTRVTLFSISQGTTYLVEIWIYEVNGTSER